MTVLVSIVDILEIPRSVSVIVTPHGETLYFLPNAIRRNKEQEELRSFSKYFSRKSLQPFLDIRSSEVQRFTDSNVTSWIARKAKGL